MQIAINQNIKNEVKDYFYITLGLMLYTFGFTVFLLPYQIVTGGVTGLAAVIYYGTGIPIYLSYFVINVILLALALKVLGLKFMLKTVYAIFMLSFLLALAQGWVTGPHGGDDQDTGRGPGLHVARHRMLLHRTFASHRIPEQWQYGRHRHHRRSDKQVSQHLAGQGAHLCGFPHRGQFLLRIPRQAGL